MNSIVIALYLFISTLTVVNGQPQPADFALRSTKTEEDLTMGEREDTIQSWATWACVLNMSIESYESQWFNGSSLLSRSGRTIIQDGLLFVGGQTPPGTAILIQNLTYLDQGEYNCQVRGTNPLTSWVSLSVTLTLVANLSPLESIVQTYNDSLLVEIGCDMSGYIPQDESLYWIVDGEEIRSGLSDTDEQKYQIAFRDGVRKAQVGGTNPTSSRVSVLIINDVELSDTKTYTCAIDGMDITEEVNLIVNEASSPNGFPQNVRVTIVSSTAVLLTWEELLEDERRGNITFYEVMCSQYTFQDIPSIMKQTDGPVLSLLVENLEEHVEYNISIRAYTIVGPGPFSPIVVVETPEDGPTDTPMNLYVVTLGENELDVSWNKPDAISINGILRLYIIEYCVVSDDNEMISSSPADCEHLNVTVDTTRVMLTNLITDTLYNVSVAAFTVEIGPFASVIRRTDGQNVQPTESKDRKGGYSVVGIVVGVILATVFLIVVTGIVYLGVNYQCRQNQMHSKLAIEEGSTISVSLSKDPELVLIPMGDGIALMRKLSAGPSISSIGDEEGISHNQSESVAGEVEGQASPLAGVENDVDDVEPESQNISVQILTNLSNEPISTDGEDNLSEENNAIQLPTSMAGK